MIKKIYADLLIHLARNCGSKMAATECRLYNGFVADVLSVQPKGVYEYEIKSSINDVHNDFREKKKHQDYRQFNKYKRKLPQYFVLVISEDIYQTVLSRVKFSSDYGIMTYREGDKGKEFRYAKQPTRLNIGKASVLRTEILRRMIQDNADLLKLYDELTSKTNREISHVLKSERCQISEGVPKS